MYKMDNYMDINMDYDKTSEYDKNNKDRDEIITISWSYAETCYFMCYTSKLFKYFTNLILVLSFKNQSLI